MPARYFLPRARLNWPCLPSCFIRTNWRGTGDPEVRRIEADFMFPIRASCWFCAAKVIGIEAVASQPVPARI
jgi:hypothetical protein